MAESETSKYIKSKLNERIISNNNQKEFFRERIIILDNEKTPLDSAIKSIDQVVLDQVTNVNDKLQAVKTAYQNRIDANTCRTDLFWVRTGINSVPYGEDGDYYIEHSYECKRTVSTGYASTVVYISSVPDGTTTVNSGLIGYQSKNLYGIRYYDEPYTQDVVDSFVAGFIGTVGIGKTTVTAMVSVDSASLGIVTTGQLLICEKNGIFTVDNNEIVGIGTTTADLSVINAGFSTQATVYQFTVETSSVGIASAPESDGSFVQFQVLKSAEQAGNLSIKFGTTPYSPQSIGIMKSSETGKGVKVEFTNEGYSSVTQSWRPELEGIKLNNVTITKPQVSAGKIYYNVGFNVKPQKRSGASWVDASEGDTGKLYFTGSGIFILPTDAIRVTTMSSCSSEQTALDSAIDTADAAEAEISSGTSTINTRLSVATTLRKERNNLNIQIWGQRQLLGKLDEEISEANTVKTSLNHDSVIGIIT